MPNDVKNDINVFDDVEYNIEALSPSTRELIQSFEDSMCVTTTPSTGNIQVDAVNACDVSALRNGSTMDDNISCNDKNDTILDYSNSSDNMNDVCAICFETLQDGDDITTSNCSKTFHRTCIITWLMLHDTCPYCRNTFKNINDAKNIDAMIVNDIFDCE